MQKRDYVMLSLILTIAVFAVIVNVHYVAADDNSSGNTSKNTTNTGCVTVADCGFGAARCVNGTCIQYDEHGCVPDGGYTWCEAKQKCLRVWEENCSSSGDTAENNSGSNEDTNKIETTGTIQFVDVEGGCWKITTNNGIDYQPTNLNDKYKQNGTIVKFEGELVSNVSSTCQVGTLIKLSDIEKVDTNSSKEDGDKAERIREGRQEKNRLGFNKSQIPEGCEIDGAALKCEINGTKTMIVFAGKSGNIIIKVEGVNASTEVQLYKDINGTLFGAFDNNQTKIINILPSDLQALIMQKTNASFNGTNITLTSKGEYEYEAEKEARFLGVFKVHEHVSWEVDPENGSVSNENAPWWGFLASDVKTENNSASSTNASA